MESYKENYSDLSMKRELNLSSFYPAVGMSVVRAVSLFSEEKTCPENYMVGNPIASSVLRVESYPSSPTLESLVSFKNRFLNRCYIICCCQHFRLEFFRAIAFHTRVDVHKTIKSTISLIILDSKL